MRSNIWTSLLLMAAGMVLPAFAQSGARKETKTQLVGTWQVQVTQIDCQSGQQLGPPFTSLLTFAQGGTMNEDTRTLPSATDKEAADRECGAALANQATRPRAWL